MAGSTSFNHFDLRRATFQRGLDIDEVRKKREDAAVYCRLSLRHQKFNDARKTLKSETKSSFNLQTVAKELFREAPGLERGRPEEKWSLLIQIFVTPNALQLQALRSLRKQLDNSGSFPQRLIYETPLSAGLIWALGVDFDEFQTEAAWCISNLTYETSQASLKLASDGAIGVLASHLHRVDELGDNAVCALSNMASEGVLIRDLVINAGVIESVVGSITQCVKMPQDHLANRIWLLSRLVEVKPLPPTKAILPMLKVIRRGLDSEAEGVIKDTLMMLSSITEDLEVLQQFVGIKLVPRLIDLLLVSSSTPLVLRVLGNISAGTDDQAQLLLDSGVLDSLAMLLSSKHVSVLREATWTYSNLLAGTLTQVKSIVYHDGMAALVRLLGHDNYKVRMNTLHSLNNLLCARDPLLAKRLLDLKALDALVGLLSQIESSDILLFSLTVLGKMFFAMSCIGEESRHRINASKPNAYISLLERFQEANGMELLEKLQYHKDPQVYTKSLEILDSHFGLEEIEPELMAPVTSAFVFS